MKVQGHEPDIKYWLPTPRKRMQAPLPPFPNPARLHYSISIIMPLTDEPVEDRLFFKLFNFLGLGDTESTWHVGHNFALVPAPDDR
jgi:hypothetical protein